MYEYQAVVTKVVDGDTIHVTLDLGLDVYIGTGLRLIGINAPEMRTEAGPLARAHLIELIALAKDSRVIVRTVKDRREKYGRYLATVILPDGTNVNDRMVADGHATTYWP